MTGNVRSGVGDGTQAGTPAVVGGTAPVRYERVGAATVLTLARPAVRNAIDGAAAQALEAGLDRAEADPDVVAVVLAAEPPAFCAGADLRAIRDGGAASLSTERGGFAGVVRRPRTLPLIAAVDGPALAGGTELVLACDLVVASTAASFGLPEVRRGLVAGGGGLFRLPRKIPVNVAAELILTGRPLTAEDAHRFGLVNRLVARGSALDEALALVAEIAAAAPLAVRESRAVMTETYGVAESDAWARSARADAVVIDSEDVREGAAAFLERRAPRWTGR